VRRQEVRSLLVAWVAAGIAGSIVFWLVQVLSGGPTITAYLGEQIVSGGGYPEGLSALVGWAVHLGVSLSYALLFGAIVAMTRRASFVNMALVTLVAALVLGWVTAVIAPPAISVTIGLLTRQGWPGDLFPPNYEVGLPLWNHVLFFLLNWVLQSLGPPLGAKVQGVQS